MRYQITGKHIDIGEALQTHVKSELGEIVEKYAQRPTDASITFSKSGHEHVCEAVIHLSTGLNAHAKGHATEIYAAFESCREKMDKQLRRYKRRLRDDHSGPNNVALPEENAAYTVFEQTPDDVPDAEDNPIIIAETRVDVPEASVSDAVMMLDLRHTNALLFRNAGTGVFNMVYRRNDGTIGWVEPQAKS
jgi:ribosomal subunit interface protein